MATDIANHLEHWLSIGQQHKDLLVYIRHWDNLKVASEGKELWIKGFTGEQLLSVTVRSIPFTQLFYCKDDQLFPAGSLLPQRKIPAWLWLPIERALPVENNSLNHNFFGITQQYQPDLVATATEQPASWLLADKKEAGTYIENAAAIRLSGLKWIVVNDTEVLIAGTPLLPLRGKAYWQKGKFILPAGYELRFPALERMMAAKMDEAGEHFIWWTDAQHYELLQPAMLQPLSIASWRQTMHTINLTTVTR